MLLVINEIPNTKILESLFFSQLEKADSLKDLLELYRQDVTQRGHSKDYDRLLQMVKCHLEERRRKKTGMNTAKAVGKEAQVQPGETSKAKEKAKAKEKKRERQAQHFSRKRRLPPMGGKGFLQPRRWVPIQT